MGKIIRVGLIGTGKHGCRYANHLINDLADKFHLVAISRRSEIGQVQAKEWDATYYQDWRKLIVANEVDAVISVTPPNINPEIMDCCIESSKPLLIEKPLTTDYATAESAVSKFKEKIVTPDGCSDA